MIARTKGCNLLLGRKIYLNLKNLVLSLEEVYPIYSSKEVHQPSIQAYLYTHTRGKASVPVSQESL